MNQDTVRDAAMEEMRKFEPFWKGIMEQNYITKWNAFRQLNKVAEPGGVVFAGDSITEGLYVHEFFPEIRNLYNRGISGISSRQLLEHIDEHIIQLAPSKVFLLIGTNDLGDGEQVESVSERIREICSKISDALPVCKIYVQSVYPVNEKVSAQAVGVRDNESIMRLNELLRKGTDRMKNVEYLNVYPLLTDECGRMKAEYTYDGLHLTVEGYKQISIFLKNEPECLEERTNESF